MNELDGDLVVDGPVTPERAIDLLQIIKEDPQNTSIVMAIDSGNKVKDFMVVEKDLESELQAEVFFAGCCSKTKVVDLLDLTISDFKEILQLAMIDPNQMIGSANEFAATVEDMAIDRGAIFGDKNGEMITVSKLEDKRKLSDFMKGNNDDGIWITFSGDKLKSEMAGNSYSLTEVRNLIETKHLCALF